MLCNERNVEFNAPLYSQNMDHLRGHLTSKWSAVKSVSPTSVEPSWLCLETVWLRSNLYSRDGLVWRSVGGRLLALYPSPTHAAVGSEAPLKPLSLARQVCMGDCGCRGVCTRGFCKCELGFFGVDCALTTDAAGQVLALAHSRRLGLGPWPKT